MGQIFTGVQLRLPHKKFKQWVATTAMSRSTAYRLMDVARAFGEYALSHSETHRITPNALYALSQPSTPPKAREQALIMLADGQKVTCKDARAIIDSVRHRPDLPTDEVKAHEERMRPNREAESKTRAEPPVAVPDSRHARAWGSLRELVAAASLVAISTVDDTEDAESLYSVRVHYKDEGPLAGPPRSCVRADLVDAVETLLGREEQKRCGHCGEMRPVSWFSANRSRKGGLTSECKTCSRPRVQDAKRRARQTVAEAA